jgi:hypothetical protein
LLALALVAAASAHWTHDDSLAQEIGPPPGEEDVATLSDAALGETSDVKDRTYRVTIGTRAKGPPNGKNNGEFHSGGSTSKFKIKMKGPDNDEAVGDKDIRYYQGPLMTYARAATMAPEFRLGMRPLIDKDGQCNGKERATHMPKTCEGALVNDLDACEPNGKACKRAVEDQGVGYAFGPVTKLFNDPKGDSYVETGMIQRGQVQMQDVGQIVEVIIREDVKWDATNKCYNGGERPKRDCSSPWSPSFVKVSTNNPQTGIGNGIYYIEPRSDLYVGTYGIKGANNQEEDKSEDLVARPRDPSTESGLPENNAFNAILTKCVASSCEEELDTKLRIAEMREEFEEAK